MQLRAVVFVFPCDLNRIINITANAHHDESTNEWTNGWKKKTRIQFPAK